MYSSPNLGEPIRSACLLLEDGRRFDRLPQRHAGVAIGEVIAHLYIRWRTAIALQAIKPRDADPDAHAQRGAVANLPEIR